MSSLSGTDHPIRRQFIAPVECNCGQHGTAIWEENIAPAPFGRRPVLLDVSSGFYVRLQRRDGKRTEIACGICEKTVAFSRASTEPAGPPRV
ncbi:MAG: hypothetical protein J0I19_02545 [Alphaproteobacteria bacterium]|nr:hypothetical protein [Alphaproteobacteria bacterium]